MHEGGKKENFFGSYVLCDAADLVNEKVLKSFIEILWGNVLSDSTGKMLEHYLRSIVSQAEPVSFHNNYVVGKSEEKTFNAELEKLQIGGCTAIQVAMDPIREAFKKPMVLLYSLKQDFPLFDMCYYNKEKQELILLQPTIGGSHTFCQALFDAVVERVDQENDQIPTKIYLLYALPGPRYDDFVIDPLPTGTTTKNTKYEIRKIWVKKPQLDNNSIFQTSIDEQISVIATTRIRMVIRMS